MSKLSIYETSWINLVFENKNKAYGAYKLRQESPKTTLFAFFFGLLFVASISGGAMLLSSFGNKPPINKNLPPIFDDSLHVSHVELKKFPPKPKVEMPKTKQASTIKNEKVLRDPIILESVPVDLTYTKTESAPTTESGTTTGTATPTTAGTEIGTTTVSTIPATATPTGPETTLSVDVMPEFPGGVQKFLKYVADNFKGPENINETVTIFMSFVIEKDGSMTDIKVLRNAGYGLDKEAIRVLKAQRTKWKPGVKNGKPVRVLYTLPIKVKAN